MSVYRYYRDRYASTSFVPNNATFVALGQNYPICETFLTDSLVYVSDYT